MSKESTDILPALIPNTLEARIDLIHRIEDYLTKIFQVYSGRDSNGREYDTIEDMWRYEGFLMREEDADMCFPCGGNVPAALILVAASLCTWSAS